MKKYIKKHKGIAVLFMIAGVLNALIGVFSSYTMQYVIHGKARQAFA